MKELTLNREAGRWAMLGGCILGGGGGGGAYLGEMLLDKLSEAPPLKLTPLSEVEDDAIVLSVSLVGAPAAPEQFLTPEAMIRTVELFRENNPGVKLGGIITNENGACATVNGWAPRWAFRRSIRYIRTECCCPGRACMLPGCC